MGLPGGGKDASKRRHAAGVCKECKAMLVLSRKAGEAIHIGDGVVVVVTEIRGGRVKLGIDAGKECSILRGEVWERQQAEKKNGGAS